MFLLWTAPIGLLLLIIVSFFDGCYSYSGDVEGSGDKQPAIVAAEACLLLVSK